LANRFAHHLDGMPAAIVPQVDAGDGRVAVWVDGHVYRVDPDYLKPLDGYRPYSTDTDRHLADDTETGDTE
jgi:gamma-glutamylcyclotransferase (GGCT)/AIG2-like uncharacterized protein YtfP